MKNALLVAVVAALAYGFLTESGISIPGFSPATQAGDGELETAYANRQNDVQVRGQGVVTRILSDDLDGSRHQRFILKLASGQTLLVAHNIDLAPRIDGLRVDEVVEFYGEYEWNAKGGVIHWTHHDPDGRHTGGWLKHGGQTFQ